MSKIREELENLPSEMKELFIPVFGGVKSFYQVVYLIVKNEHLTEEEKPDRYEDRLQVIRRVKEKVQAIIDGFNLDGREVIADIASDYFEDYIEYGEPEWEMSQEEFVRVIKKITE